MLEKTANPLDNAILAGLPADGRDFLFERLLTKPVCSGEILYEPGAPLIHLIFPQSGLVSLQAVFQDGRTVEKAAVGRDSVVGILYLLGERVFPSHAVVAISGQASWLSVHDLDAALARSPAMQAYMNALSLKLIHYLMRGVACASAHSASQRIAKWLLYALDRSTTNQFDLTQRTLANIFGLRLATISDACARLNAAGAIDQARGTLTVIDREKLEAQACECYRRWEG
jgi:CRP-like cAMP-binding protein